MQNFDVKKLLLSEFSHKFIEKEVSILYLSIEGRMWVNLDVYSLRTYFSLFLMVIYVKLFNAN